MFHPTYVEVSSISRKFKVFSVQESLIIKVGSHVVSNGNDDAAYGSSGDDQVSNEEAAAYANADDDVFHWNSNVGFDGVSVMPLSCIN